jgi:hypothetical protein
MRITNAVFQELNEKELDLYKECKGRLVGIHRAGIIYEYPDKIRYCLELFPSNYLDHKTLKKEEELSNLCEDFKILFDDTNTKEQDILNFIRDRGAYHIIGSIQKENYNFGHHGTFIFPEFKLGSSYEADYLILGKNSDGFHLVFVELQNPYGKIVISNGDEGEEIRKGLNQVDDWDRWIEGNYSSISEVLERYKHPNLDLPKEFYKLDKTRIKYVVVAGRRSDFSEKLRWKKRKLSESKKIILLHYDNLYDFAVKAIGENTY